MSNKEFFDKVKSTMNTAADSLSTIAQNFVEKNRTKAKLNEILALNTGKPLADIERDTDRDNFLTAQQALEYGLIDKVFDKRA